MGASGTGICTEVFVIWKFVIERKVLLYQQPD